MDMTMATPVGRGQPVAVLVDGENISAMHVDAILSVARGLGDPIVRRVYGNASLLPHWEKVPGCQFVHTSSGKNFADMRIAIDAMDLAHVQAMRRFVLVSSDRDFAPLALRLREMGATVAGFGHERAGPAFRDACSAFHVAAAETGPVAPCQPQRPATLAERVAAELRKFPANEGIAITELNARIRREAPVNIADQPGKSWRGFLNLHPTIFACDPKGPNARVRLRKAAAQQVTPP